MKNNIITTQIFVPQSKRYNWTEEDRIKENEFKAAIVQELELPEDWNKYLKLAGTFNFISLEGLPSYKADKFRKFVRGKVASYPSELKHSLKEYIERKQTTFNKEETERNNFQDAVKFLEPAISIFRNNEFKVHVNTDTSIEILLMDTTKDNERYWYADELGKCTIKRDGTITRPIFSNLNYKKVSIKTMQQWIADNEGNNTKLIEKTKEIKLAIPETYFTSPL